MKFNEFYIVERNDYEFGNKISNLVDKINKFLKANSYHLREKADIDKDGSYWYNIEQIDKKYKDLFIVLSPEEQNNKLDTMARYTKFHFDSDPTTYYHKIELNILSDNLTIDDPNLGKTIADSSKISQALYHEITHYFDSHRDTRTQKELELARRDVKNFDTEDAEKLNKQLQIYYNLPDELNAYFNEVSISFIKYLKSNKKNKITEDFNKFKDTFLTIFNNHGVFDKLSEKNKKNILKRIYTFWNELVDITEYN